MPAGAETGGRPAPRALAAMLAVAVGAAGCAGSPTFQGRGYHGNEYSLVTRGVDPGQRTRQALREAAQFCESQGLGIVRSEEHTSELQSRENLVCRLLLEK